MSVSNVKAAETIDGLEGSRPRARGPQRLVVTSGPDRGRARALDREEITIGKREDADLPLTDPTVSRHHCVVVAAPFGALIRDLGSRNGVRIDGHWIESAYLRTGALVRLGETVLVLDSNQPVAADAEARDQHLGAALGSSRAMQRIFGLVPRLANSDASLLIEGETGTGKTLLSEVIHKQSLRQEEPFIVIDCGAIPTALIESELFGHERGAFTGATSLRAGAFEAAAGGTVLLDEIGELPLEMQPKLLRAIEQRVIRRVGSNEDRPMNVRIIAATNRDLEQEVRKGRFRSDLYYRLVAVRIAIPPLRDRREDIPALANHFAQRFGGAEAAPLPRAMIDTFMRQSWPGNIRELRNAVERAILLGESSAAEVAFSSAALTPSPVAVGVGFDDGLSFRELKERAVDVWEGEYLGRLLRRAEGNISRAARIAQMDRNYLREILRKHGLGRNL
ncbi:MAG: sigma 54-interacting transcriptional regulator [Polyangia bacterium]